MRILISIVVKLLFFGLLTIATQIGGVIYLISLSTHRIIEKKVSKVWIAASAKVGAFALLYIASTLFLVPLLAEPLGRVPLPIFEKGHLKPATIWTCLLNRNYVRPTLKEVVIQVADDLYKQHTGTTINYLDANFPFIDKFPLLPHLSHNDGKKLDLSFQYDDAKTGVIESNVPSPIGYGVCEEPTKGEIDFPEVCSKKGFWQYNLLRNLLVSQKEKTKFVFNKERTKDMINYFVSQDRIGIIFLEPHLKARLKLTSGKIRFHGCHAVRHDDHLHIQLK